ncbi:MAG: PAS domain-containing protein, partial [Endomicrobium sp.]|uniref:PAS domain-containing protein n=1 Tax=Candidatus Endomicrobiellum cubanum TaxID=3242325 RepID=UPI00281E6678|nr:PAS domain-containing protein [Endomicrobium sp.]
MENIISNDSEEIESVVAMLRNFAPKEPIENAVIYFWESHNKHSDEKMKTQATADLIYKEFDLLFCEKYEVRTGYLSRWNYMPKPLEICSKDEIAKAIIRGKEEESEWLNRCQPDFPDFIKKDWQDCISGEKNPYYESCKSLVIKKINSDEIFANAFSKSVDEFLSTHNTDRINCNSYIIEETSWILTLPLLHLNKPIYLVHIGSANSAVVAMFHHFSNLQKAVKWLSPRFSVSKFQNASEFLLDYRNALHVGHSYAVENKQIVQEVEIFKKQKEQNLKNSEKLLKNESIKNNLLSSIIDEIPCHLYWLDYNNVYQGCNYIQAKTLGLSCSVDIIGKTNYDLHSVDEANKLNEINYAVMSTGHIYESEDTISLDGQFKKFLSKKTPLFDAVGKVIGLLGVSFDITDKKRAEELERQKGLYEIAKGVAHDICSPLAALEMVK